MARDRFGFLERHGTSMPGRYPLTGGSLLSRFAPRAGLVALRQIFVRRCHEHVRDQIVPRWGRTGFQPCPGANLLLRAKDLFMAATALFWPAGATPARNSTTGRVKIALEFTVTSCLAQRRPFEIETDFIQ